MSNGTASPRKAFPETAAPGPEPQGGTTDAAKPEAPPAAREARTENNDFSVRPGMNLQMLIKCTCTNERRHVVLPEAAASEEVILSVVCQLGQQL